MHLEKIWLDKIQNGRLSAIIHFHMVSPPQMPVPLKHM